MRKLSGFTLAELLISLAILGVIATFTIPKVLSAQANERKKAVIKEVIAALSDVTYQAVLTRDGKLTPDTFYQYYRDHLNTVKQCDSNVNTQKCWTQPFTPPNSTPYQGFVLHNGATLASFTVCCDLGGGQQGNGIAVDWNGPELPNTYGDDQFELVLSWGTVPITDWGTAVYRPGTVSPEYDEPASVSLYQSVFQ